MAADSAQRVTHRAGNRPHTSGRDQRLCQHGAAGVPTLTPRLAIKLSIFWAALRKPMAHKNQISTFPVTVSRPTASTCACTSASLIAEAGNAKDTEKITASTRMLVN